MAFNIGVSGYVLDVEYQAFYSRLNGTRKLQQQPLRDHMGSAAIDFLRQCS